MGMNAKRLWVASWVFKVVPPSRGNELKASLLRWAGAEIGKNCEIMSSARVVGDFSLKMGNNCFVGHDALIAGAKGSSVYLEDFAKIGSRVILVTGSHRFSPEGQCIEKEGTHADIRVGAGAVVSTGSIVLPGVIVNRMAHVAPGAVVTREVPEYHRVAGVPARVIKDFRVDLNGETQVTE